MSIRSLVWGLWFASASSWAAEPAATWAWPEGKTLRYVLSADVTTPNVLPMWSVRNSDPLVAAFRVDVVTTCRVDYAVGRKAWALRCEIDDASFRGMPAVGDTGRIAPVAVEWEQIAEGGWVQVTMGRDGRMRGFDLEDVTKGNPREQLIHQVMREMLRRAYAPLCAQLPKHGFADGLSWTQRSGAVLSLPNLESGTVGGAVLTHTVAGRSPVGWVTAQRGEGVLGWGTSADDTTPLRDLLRFKLDGSYLFDSAGGHIVQAQHVGRGEPTAGSAQATTANAFYAVNATARLLPPDADPPTLPSSGEYTQ